MNSPRMIGLLQRNQVKEEKYTILLVALSACIGMFMPSSIYGIIDPRLTVLACGILWVLAILIGIVNGFSISRIAIALFILSALLLATFISPFTEYTVGALAPYVLFTTVLSLTINMCRTTSSPNAIIVFEALSLAIQAFGLSIVFGSDAGIHAASSLYQAFYSDLFEQMILWYHKPITVFASHSIAGFAYFAFLITHVKLFTITPSKPRRIFNAISIIIYLLFLVLLTSNTGFILFSAAGVWISYKLFVYGSRRAKVATWSLTMIATIGLLYGVAFIKVPFADIAVDTMTSSGGGFLGRYSGDARLQPTYNYLLEHPFRPIGITYSDQVILGDNFIAEYVIRGSMPLYLGVLLASALFFKKNIQSRRVAIGFFLFFLISDIGYPLLTYYRASAIILLFILVWNHCSVIETLGKDNTSKMRQIAVRRRPRFISITEQPTP